jgi:type III restriction enzyme
LPILSGFPTDPSEVIEPQLRWYPGADASPEDVAKLMPPLVSQIRRHVHNWRQDGYPDISETSRDLLRHWFGTEHLQKGVGSDEAFRYYFAQREAVETAVWLFENQKAHKPNDLIRYSAHSELSVSMFEENWPRYVFTLATGAGKTKVLSLLIAWCYFHNLYEEGSSLSRNFLLLAPNIIVLDRLRTDFDGLSIFFSDPVLPPAGWGGRNWRGDFAPQLHIQDDVGPLSPDGNIFLSNIHRVYGASSDEEEVVDVKEFFLGAAPKTDTSGAGKLASRLAQLDDLVVLNDEAHHIHDSSLAWFRAIEELDMGLRRRTRGKGLALQLDVTATPKKSSGAVFPQTVSSYPLVEAIRQGVVKTPVLPDEKSRNSLRVQPSSKFSEEYSDHIHLGVLEYMKYYEKLASSGKKPILFIMTMTTAQADEVSEFLQRTYPQFHQKTLVIHTNAQGEIKEKSAKPAELNFLRQASREIDSNNSPFLAVVSVLMLREGWDVKNVVAMVGLRPYSSDSKILPEQTLGRGLRRMFPGDVKERVSVVGTPAFLDFVEQIQFEGVELDVGPMGQDSEYRGPLVVEIEQDKRAKRLGPLDIELPILSRRIRREHGTLGDLDVKGLSFTPLQLMEIKAMDSREIVFFDIDTQEVAWRTNLNQEIPITSQAVLVYLVNVIFQKLRLVGEKDVLYEKLKVFVTGHLFGEPVNLDSEKVLRNVAQVEAQKVVIDAFSKGINSLTLVDNHGSNLVGTLKISDTRPAVVKNQEFVLSDKTLFNRVVGDSRLELQFAQFLSGCDDVQAFAKNHLSVGFKIEYVNSQGEISNYLPDFFVKLTSGQVFIVETKGLADVETHRKWDRLVKWCEDATDSNGNGTVFSPLYVTQDDFYQFSAGVDSFGRLAGILRDSRPAK